MSDDEYAGLQNHLSQHPDAGALIPGTGGVRKVRWAGSGRGKRGGSRLIYYWDCGDRILMLYVYLKNERENLTEGQKKLMKEIAEGYKHLSAEIKNSGAGEFTANGTMYHNDFPMKDLFMVSSFTTSNRE